MIGGMIASTSNNTDTFADQTVDHGSVRSVSLLSYKNKSEKDESESDSDDFGDFETAAQTVTEENEGESRENDVQQTKEDLPIFLPCSSSSSLQMNHSSFDLQISRLLEETLRFSESEYDHFLLSHCQPFADNSMANVFSLFDTDLDNSVGSEPTEKEGFALKSLCLWQKICRFDETRLLSIQWENSRGREFLSNALPWRKPFEAADHPNGKARRHSPPGNDSSRVQF
ncbi:hypothetical protein niasHS_010926 [Heterodera schachtii]|uniref:Uncharacterized protein n=1 Tax=Heterodera schachtii TaxID=97005 RepID=A0ABD2IT04_HETSC